MWYEYEVGRASWSQGRHAQGLRHFNMIEKHFSDIIDDQFDFHSFALRKYSIRGYIEMVDFQEQVYRNINFLRAAAQAIPKFIRIAGHPLPDPKRKKKKKAAETAKDKARENVDYYGTAYLAKIKDHPLQEALNWATKVLQVDFRWEGRRKDEQTYVLALI